MRRWHARYGRLGRSWRSEFFLIVSRLPLDKLQGYAAPLLARIFSSNITSQDFGGIDFSKLGGAAADEGEEEEEDDDEEDDEEMPGLEGEEEAGSSSKSKIQEV